MNFIIEWLSTGLKELDLQINAVRYNIEQPDSQDEFDQAIKDLKLLNANRKQFVAAIHILETKSGKVKKQAPSPKTMMLLLGLEKLVEKYKNKSQATIVKDLGKLRKIICKHD